MRLSAPFTTAENARRRALAAERRRIRKRTTLNPCPTREAILDAWIHRRDSHTATIRFGSLIEDLECYLDNSLRFDENGVLVGRDGGIKRWLQAEIPALYLRYTTVMRFKAAARKLRQLMGIADPIPATRIIQEEVTPDEPAQSSSQQKVDKHNSDPQAPHGAPDLLTPFDSHGDAERQGHILTACAEQAPPCSHSHATCHVEQWTEPGEQRQTSAHAKWLELTASLAANPTALFRRLDELLAPGYG